MIPGNKMWDGATGKLIRDTSFVVKLPAKTLVQTGSSKELFEDDHLTEATPGQRTELTAAYKDYKPGATPECYWTLADPTADIDHFEEDLSQPDPPPEPAPQLLTPAPKPTLNDVVTATGKQHLIDPDLISCSCAIFALKYPLSVRRSVPTTDKATW